MANNLLEFSLYLFLIGFCFLILFIRRVPLIAFQETRCCLYLRSIYVSTLIILALLLVYEIYRIEKLYIPSILGIKEIINKITNELCTFNWIKNIGFLIVLGLSIAMHWIGTKREKNYYLFANIFYTSFTIYHGFFLSEDFFHFKKEHGFWKGEFSLGGIIESLQCILASMIVFVLYFLVGILKQKFKQNP